MSTTVLFFLAVPWVCLQFVIVVVPGHTHLLLLNKILLYMYNLMVDNISIVICLQTNDTKLLCNMIVANMSAMVGLLTECKAALLNLMLD